VIHESREIALLTDLYMFSSPYYGENSSKNNNDKKRFVPGGKAPGVKKTKEKSMLQKRSPVAAGWTAVLKYLTKNIRVLTISS